MPQRPGVGELDVGRVQAAQVLDGPQEARVGLEDDRLGIDVVVVELEPHLDVGRRQQPARGSVRLKRKRLGPWASSEEASTGMMLGTSCAAPGTAASVSSEADASASQSVHRRKRTPARAGTRRVRMEHGHVDRVRY